MMRGFGFKSRSPSRTKQSPSFAPKSNGNSQIIRYKMTPKKKKTQKLRQELSEYTSLIRALHTASTQDLLPHLIGAFPRPPSSRATSVHPSRSSGSSSTSGGGGHHGSGTTESTSSEVPDDARDIWTRWPLLRKDVYVPEWSLHDEVRSIAEKSAREWLQVYASEEEPNASLSSSPHKMEIDEQDKPSDHSEDDFNAIMDHQIMVSSPRRSTSTNEDANRVSPLPEEDVLTKGVLSGLTLESSMLLSQIFAALAAHRPPVDSGLQNRLRAMDWKSAFSVIGSAGIFDQRIMQDVQTKMEQIHSEEDHRVLARLQVHGAAKRKLKDLEDSLGTQVDVLHFTRPRKKRGGNLSTQEMIPKYIKAASDEEHLPIAFGPQER